VNRMTTPHMAEGSTIEKIVVSTRPTRRYEGRAVWKDNTIKLYITNMWRNTESVCGLCKDTDLNFRLHILTIKLNQIMWHEFMHLWLKENKIHPWTCNRCTVGKCKLCNMTDRLLEYFA